MEVNLARQGVEGVPELDERPRLRHLPLELGGGLPDPNTFLDMFVTNGGNNRTGYSSAEYDKLIVDASREADPAKRALILQAAEKLLIQTDLPLSARCISTWASSSTMRKRSAGSSPTCSTSTR